MSRNAVKIASTTPFLRWAGSKRQIIPILSEYWKSSYLRYVEPFAGSASLFFHLIPPKALLADINKELIETYCQIKTRLPHVLKELYKFPNGKDHYLKLRSVNPSILSPEFRAARFIYLNRFCFNGLYRTNRQGYFNVPYGGGRSGDLPTPQQFQLWSQILKKTTLLAADFEKTLQNVREGDFVYMDPPFAVKKRRVFNEYNPNAFDYSKVEILREWLMILNSRNISFLVSYAHSDEAKFLSRGFNTRAVTVRRNIAGFADRRKIDTELLIFN